MDNILYICSSNYSSMSAKELTNYNFKVLNSGTNWVLSEPDNKKLSDLCFPHYALLKPADCNVQSVNDISRTIFDFFFEKNKDNKIEKKFNLIFSFITEEKGLSNRVKNIEKNFMELFKKRMSRVSKLAENTIKNYNEILEGLFVFFYDFDKFFISGKAIYFGQRRMKDDAEAPSRSYLKIEEAYYILGKEPQADETVCDLGASPGGWSYSAYKRSAKVLAIDNGKLKKGAFDTPYIKHITEDAFKFKPVNNKTYDWLFCDIVEHPKQVLGLLQKWLENRWCRNFIVNLKFGYVDPVSLITDLKDKNSFLNRLSSTFKIKHLYHDRDEVTLTGIAK